jgi:Mitochondrial resolvase Ydc2 / RNA splicing MRS1
MAKPVNVMSFDIGIKNMAYCVLSVDIDVKILDWRVIDISKNDTDEDELVIKTCSCKTKTTLCKKKAKFTSKGIVRLMVR